MILQIFLGCFWIGLRIYFVIMSQNCKSTYTAATTRDANNNTLYHGGTTPVYGGRGYSPPSVTNGNYQQVTAKVLFGSMTAINDLKQQKTGERERRKH